MSFMLVVTVCSVTTHECKPGRAAPFATLEACQEAAETVAKGMAQRGLILKDGKCVVIGKEAPDASPNQEGEEHI